MNESSLQDLDFLPAEFRRSHLRLQWQPWRVVVMAAVAIALVVAAASQYQRRQRLCRELAELAPRHDAVQRQTVRLAAAETRLKALQADAELLTYLRHPWPRTRILDEVLGPLPKEILFEQILLQREAPARPLGPRGPKDAEAEAKAEAALAPATRDLKTLRHRIDSCRIVLNLHGCTTDLSALHRYLGELNRSPLFAKAELTSCESLREDGPPRHRFGLLLVVRPGYGQPGGPTGAPGGADRGHARQRPARPCHGQAAPACEGLVMKASLLTTGWVVPLAMVAGGAAYFGGIFLPGQRAIREQAALLAGQREFVAQGSVLEAAILADEREAARAGKCVAAWKQVSPTEDTLPALFGRLDALVKEAGAVTTHFNPQEEENLTRLRRIPLLLGFSGKFSQVAKVLQDLETLGEMVWIDELRLESVKEDRKDVLCEVSLSIFADNPENSDKVKSSQ